MTTHYGTHAKKHLDDNCPEWASIPLDEDVKVCHTTCSAGEDTRNRMSILNKGGAFLWHCYNCGDSGYYRAKESYSPIASGLGGVCRSLGPAPKWQEIWRLSESDPDKWPTHARLWLAEYELLEEAERTLYIRYSEAKNALLLPVWHYNSVQGIQLRNFNKGMPKYTTYVNSDVPYSKFYTKNSTPIFVEDLLSSYKVALAGGNSVCLLGTSLKGSPPPSDTGTGVLWLDEDLAGHAGAIKLYKELDPFYSDGVVTMFNKQPKEVDMATLKSIVEKIT